MTRRTSPRKSFAFSPPTKFVTQTNHGLLNLSPLYRLKHFPTFTSIITIHERYLHNDTFVLFHSLLHWHSTGGTAMFFTKSLSPKLSRLHHCHGTVGGAEFFVNPLHMISDRVVTYAQQAGDFLVCSARAHGVKYFLFSCRQAIL